LPLFVSFTIRDAITEGQFCIGGNVAWRVNKLKIANEAATGITKAGVVDIRCLELDTTGVIVFFGFSDFRVQILQGGDGGAKAVERHNTFNQKSISAERRISAQYSLFWERRTYVSIIGLPSTSISHELR
jgi:hypothetical protein